jgi:hypothetical protein
MPDSDEAAINLRRLAMQLASQLPTDGKLAREVLAYMEQLIEWEGQRLEDARIVLFRAASRGPLGGVFGLHLMLNLAA